MQEEGRYPAFQVFAPLRDGAEPLLDMLLRLNESKNLEFRETAQEIGDLAVDELLAEVTSIETDRQITDLAKTDSPSKQYTHRDPNQADQPKNNDKFKG